MPAMLWRLAFVGLLAVRAEAFAPTPMRWDGLPGRNLYLGSDGSAAHRLMILDQPHGTPPRLVPSFTATLGSTITWREKNLCVEASGSKSGATIRLDRCTGGSTQRWDWLPVGRGQNFQIQLQGTKQCFDVIDRKGGMTGATIELRECENKASEAWRLEAIPFPTKNRPQHSAAFTSMRHILMSTTVLVLIFSASFWWWQKKSRLSINGGVQFWSIGQGGVSLTLPMGMQPNDVYDARCQDPAGALVVIANLANDCSESQMLAAFDVDVEDRVSAMRQANRERGNASAISSDSARSSAPTMKLDVKTLAACFQTGLQRSPVKLPMGVKTGDKPQDFEISEEQRRALYADGAIIIRGVLNEEWLEYLRGVTEWQLENPHSMALLSLIDPNRGYDYCQRSPWSTNTGFADFLYYSPVASALASCIKARELRLTSDLLMVNPNKGFDWHQDNQNGPIDAHGKLGANEWSCLRFWVTMDDCPPDHGAPVYLKKSHLNTDVSLEAVQVDLDKDNLRQYPDLLEFRPNAGDLIVWHPRAIHRIDGPTSKDWDQRKRRVLGGTVTRENATYLETGRLVFNDMGSHTLTHGDPLKHPLFPKLYPCSVKDERAVAAEGGCMRTSEGYFRLLRTMPSFFLGSQFKSFLRVLQD